MNKYRNSISEITIRGFKSIEDLSRFKLGGLNVLIGANGSGKSNFISFFRMLTHLSSEQLEKWVAIQMGSERILTLGASHSKRMYSSIHFGLNSYDFKLEPTVDERLIFGSERLGFDGPMYGQSYIHLGSGHREARIKEEFKAVSEEKSKYSSWKVDTIKYCFESINSWRVYHFHDTSDTAAVKRRSATRDNSYLRQDASNLSAYLYKVKNENPLVYEEIIEVIKLVLPFFDDFHLEPNIEANDESFIRLLWKQRGSDYIFWPSQLSDGSLRFICLVVALLQPDNPSTIIFDEPELGLHPFALQVLGGLFKKTSLKMQVIIATQSVAMLNEFDVEDIVVVDKHDEFSTFERLDRDKLELWLEDYTLGEIWEKNIINGRPK